MADPRHHHDRSSSDSPVSSLNSPRTTRFVEATTVHSPIDTNESRRSPFADPPNQQKTPPDVSDLGFGYVAANDPAQHASHHQPPPGSPLKSAMKVPGTPGRTLNPLSPTFREEFFVEKHDQLADKENARDVKIKLRVRLAKIFLRFINFGCSLIVLAILATTLTVFNATKALPSRNDLPAWAEGTNPWAQYVLLVVACVSLFACVMVFWGYFRGGHKRAEKMALYGTLFSIGFFFFSMIMWIVSAAIYQSSKANGDGQDMWGWSCNQNLREKLFHEEIDYALLCRLQDWGLVCAIIEIVIEVLVILIYAVVFYRFITKRRLAKSMDHREKARSQLHLAQRFQSAPNTPGFGPGTPYGFPQTPKSPWVSSQPQDPYSAAENGEHGVSAGPHDDRTIQYATPRSPTRPQPTFQLQPPPIRVQNATPKTDQGGWPGPVPAPVSAGFAPPTPFAPNTPFAPPTPGLAYAQGQEQMYPPVPIPAPPGNIHHLTHQFMGPAPGEAPVEAVPIPKPYGDPMRSTDSSGGN